MTLKTLKFGKTTSDIKLEHDVLDSQEKTNITALAILLGGYNEYGRGIPVGKYQEIRSKFGDCIKEIASLL